MSAHRTPIEVRLSRRLAIDPERGCWLWTGTLGREGYARIYEGGSHGRTLAAHRVAYELFVGPIPEGLTLDHLCRVRHCCNPAHLEPVTIRENVMRGDTPAARNRDKTHCLRGHPLVGSNVYIYADGRRACKRCIADRNRERRRDPKVKAQRAAYERMVRARAKESGEAVLA